MRISGLPKKGKPQSLREDEPSGNRVLRKSTHREHLLPQHPTPERRCLRRKAKVSLSLHIHASITVPSVQCRHVSTALLLSIHPHVTPIPRDLK